MTLHLASFEILSMRQLLLLRHAKSSWDDPAMSDHARPLNARGRHAAAAMRTALRGLGLTPDVVLVSSARRTLQTLEALEPWDENPIIEPMNTLYLATPPQILSILHGVTPTVRSVMVVGHNPGLHDLAMMLAGAQSMSSERHNSDPTQAQRLREGFPAGALAEFTVAADWRELAEGGGRLERFLCPRDLPEMAT
jgi:phosphohistidine phosphatase